MATTDTDLVLQAEKAQRSSSPSLVLSSVAFLGSIVEGACAILVASSSVKLFLGLGAVAAAVKASRLHADIVRVPILLVSAATSLLALWILWNSWRAQNQSAARWRRRRMTAREKLSLSIAFSSSVLTLALVVGEAIAHPFFDLY